MSNPYQSPESSDDPYPVDDVETPGVEIVAPLFYNRGWMKFLGIMLLIGGILYCLTIIGIIVGWAPIVIGIKLLGAARALEDGYPSQSPATLTHGMQELSGAIKIAGIMAIISLVLMALYFLGIIMFIIFGIAAGASSGF